MRLFTAFPVSEPAKEKFFELQRGIVAANPDVPVKWSEKNQCHLTLEFFGETEPGNIMQIQEVIKDTAKKFHAFKFSFGRLAAFPDWKRPEVLVLSINDLSGAVAAQKEMNEKFRVAGYTDSKRIWRPHLTLGRIKDKGCVFSGLNSIKFDAITWSADEIELVESRLGSRGPRYETIASFALQKSQNLI